MKKMYIVVQSRLSIHKVCTDDLSKMYYFQKKVSPALPVYIDDHDIDDQRINIINLNVLNFYKTIIIHFILLKKIKK